MARAAEMFAQSASVDAAQSLLPDLKCRVYELETENSRLRLLVGELLVANQQLREKNKGASGPANL